jgi:hypothetical protein
VFAEVKHLVLPMLAEAWNMRGGAAARIKAKETEIVNGGTPAPGRGRYLFETCTNQNNNTTQRTLKLRSTLPARELCTQFFAKIGMCR